MIGDFRVIKADSEDLEGIFVLLKQRLLQPDAKLWRKLCETLSRNDVEIDILREEVPFIVVDRIGVPRGFFTIHCRHHPTYRSLLDVPVVAVEHGPNENQIARAIFDHVLEVADHKQVDTLHFGCASNGWEQQRVPDPECRLGGTVMPFGIRLQRQSEPPKSSSVTTPNHQPFVGRSSGQCYRIVEMRAAPGDHV